MTQDSKQAFGKWRSLLWPIHSYELKKLLPMFLMFFCISFNYTILRDTKDVLVVTAAGSGAEAIPFLKFWCVMPAAVIFMLVYSKLSNILNKETLFYATITPFIVFFALFALVLYPNKEYLHPTASADALAAMLPQGCMGLIAIYRNWTYSVFYILAELWGSVALSLLFWGFANDITKVTEAKRFYHLFGLGANLALLCSGPTIAKLADVRSILPPEVDAWGFTLNCLMGLAVFMGIIVVGCYWWIHRNVLTDPAFIQPGDAVKTKKSKPKMSIGESMAFLVKSPYVLLLATLVIAYGISINLVEVSWKNQLKLQYPNSNDYAKFMGYFSMTTGIVTCFMVLFVSRSMISKGWGFAAMITPVVLAVTGMGFFGFVLFNDALTGMVAFLGATPLWLGVLFGAAQNIMSKATKYSLFDPTKEMAYIPLDQESKVKGKAAIDVVGARLGKSGGSLIQQGLVLACGSIGAICPYVASVLLAIIVLWLFAVVALNKRFVALTEQQKATPEGVKAPATATV